ncbi:MAG TPA: PLP-dependent aminotransferase family protein [Dehalococcoidia bacterium]|nr:PLP-dependent aminotransferase family protein [Dehalococcoidia bacterium]
MDFALILPGEGPRGERLVEALREAILGGRLAPGERLPPSRALAAQLGISRGTVVAAFEELVSEGYCAARVGAGTFVTVSAPPRREPPPSVEPALSGWGRRLVLPVAADGAGPPTSLTSAENAPGAPVPFDFRPGLAAEPFPAEALGRALRRAAAYFGSEYSSGHPAGSPRLRAALAAHLAHARAVRATAEQVIVVSGSQQGIDLATRLLLEPGDRVCIEEPGYPRARAVFGALGARLAPVPVDGDGLDHAALPAEGARMVYVTPSHQYPTGAVLAPERRLALLDWAQQHDAWLLEDDYDSEFRYSGPPLPAMQGMDRAGRCLYLGSLSKLLHPALRVGYLVVPPALVPAAVAAKSTLDQATSPAMQEALADLFESGEVERHLRRALRGYRARRACLLAAFASHLPAGVRVWPVTGGLHAFIEAPAADPVRLHRETAARGVAINDAAPCYQSAPPGTRLILWFGRIPPARIESGVAALAEALRAATLPRAGAI